MAASERGGVTIRQVAEALGMPFEVVRDLLREAQGVKATREETDRVFKTARRLGYDFRKLKIGKLMQARKEVLDELLGKLGGNPAWGRTEILKFLKESRALLDRVHERTFRDEFGGGRKR